MGVGKQSKGSRSARGSVGLFLFIGQWAESNLCGWDRVVVERKHETE